LSGLEIEVTLAQCGTTFAVRLKGEFAAFNLSASAAVRRHL